MQELNNQPETTPYADLHFWAKYELYARESFHRHRRAVNMLMHGCSLGKILDLGCGKVMEGSWLAAEHNYFGVDRDPKEGSTYATLKADYRTDLGLVRKSCEASKFQPDTILSLFSIEPTGEDWQNEGIYNTLLIRFPTVKQIISAGFYYEDKEFDPWVMEAEGLKSHQTSQFTPLLKGSIKETRLYEHAPSALFGDKVVEVWRLIERA